VNHVGYRNSLTSCPFSTLEARGDCTTTPKKWVGSCSLEVFKKRVDMALQDMD